MLLQISEPGESPAPHQKKRAVGIDLGTTNTLVSTVRSGTPETIADADGHAIIPSIVHYGEHGTHVGRQAVDYVIDDPLNTVVSVKRMIGRGISDIKGLGDIQPYEMEAGENGVPLIKTRAGEYTPVEISAEILRAVKARAEEALAGGLDGVVITVPAYFDDAQRQATKDAATLAGLKLLRLLNEPTAAAVAYGLDKALEQKDGGVIAVYDLGGGTFDISILKLSAGVFEVIATGGDSGLGGDDLDNCVAKWIMQQVEMSEQPTPSEQRQLLNLARMAKEALSENTSTQISYRQQDLKLTRENFANLVQTLVDRTIKSCRKTLRDADLAISEIDHVVLVGGSTRAHCVRQAVEAFFKQAPMVDIDPDRVVALGAAIQADILVGNKRDSELLLLDVIPLSLGLETMGNLVERIIDRNTTIPVAKAQEFTTFKDGQTAMSIHVLQGERDLASDCRSLAKFVLTGIPPMVAGAAHIEVTFQVDADGLLNVTAMEKSSGVQASIEVKPSYGLSDESITQMLQASFAHAEDDMRARALSEVKVDAERLIEALSSALEQEGKELLSASEYEELQGAIARLQQAHNGSDADALKDEIEGLNALSETFAARRMNASIAKALRGKSLEDIEQE